MKNKTKTNLNQKGFTIVELIIASTVFSTMMLLATSGVIQIGKIYYKGVVTNRTQEAVRALTDDISRNYQTSTAEEITKSTTSGVSVLCIGSNRYTYMTGFIQNAANPTVMWVDRLRPGASGCTPVNLTNPTADPNSDSSDFGRSVQRKVLPNNMRIVQLDADATDGNLSLSIRLAFGDLDLSPDNATCLPINQGGQFCAISSSSSYVKKR